MDDEIVVIVMDDELVVMVMYGRAPMHFLLLAN